MKRKIFNILSIVFALALVVGFSLVPAVPAGADGVVVPDRVTAITKAADRLVALQNADGGFPWKAPGTGISYTNILGITAMGILEGWKLDAKATYEAALAKAYKYCVDKPPTYTWDAGKSKYKETTQGVDSFPDITFLVWLSQAAAGSPSLLTAINTLQDPDITAADIATLAKTRWDDRVSYLGSTQQNPLNGTATGLAQYIRDTRHNSDLDALIPWDLETGVKAAQVLDGYYPGQNYNWQAMEIANVIFASVDDGIYFSSTDDTQEDYIAGLTGAIEAFRETDSYEAKVAELVSLLLAEQQLGGYWNYYGATPATMSVQSTAYAVMALQDYGAGAVTATWKAADWLASSQKPADGGWHAESGAGDEYAEIDSEAAWALARLPAPVTVGTKGYYSIQHAINAASPGDTIQIAAGTYDEALNLGGKTLTIEGAGVEATIVDASSFTGYAVKNFGNSTTIRNLKLIGTSGTSNSYGFKVSQVSDITLENIRVENSGNTAFDLNTVEGAILTDIEAVGTLNGFGLMILDSNNVAVTNVATSGNAWGGVSVQTKDNASDSIIFSGNFDAQEDNPLLLEQDPDPDNGTYYDITNITIPSQFTHIVYAFRVKEGADPENYKQTFYRLGQQEAKTFAQSLIAAPPPYTYSNMTIYDIAGENYYVIEGMSIQTAINAASGTTINVAAGTYSERITITKPLTLLGATWDVNKNGYTVPPGYAWDDSVESIIQNPDPALTESNVVDIISDDVVFEGFIVQSLNALQGSSNDHLIRLNATTGTANDGLNVEPSLDNITIKNNVIGPNTNVASQDGTHGRMGLYLASPTYPADETGITNSTISGNKIFDCKGNGNNVFVWGAAKNYSSPARADYTGTVIEDNEIYGSHRSGIEIAGGVKNLVIRNNDIYGNSGYPGDDPILKYGTGIVVIRMGSDKTDPQAWGTDNLLIEDNNIYNNEKNGIYFGPINTNNTIIGNTFYGNGWDAIRIDLTEEYHGGVNVVTDVASGIAAQFNNIYDNVGYGAQVVGAPTNGFVLDATNNWWGAKNGPSDGDGVKDPITGKSAAGSGDKVSAKVRFDPWTGAEVKDSKTETVSDNTVDARDEADTDVIVDGSTTVTVAEYSSDPGTGGFTGSTGKYIDVSISDNTNVTEITIKLYYTQADLEASGMAESTLRLRWFGPAGWVDCWGPLPNDYGVDPTDIPAAPPLPAYSGYMWAKIRAAGTIPTLGDLTGSVFGGGGAAAVGGGGGGGGGGGLTLPTVKGLVSTPPIKLDAEGAITARCLVQTEDGKLTLDIARGTRLLDALRRPLTSLSAELEPSPPAPPSGAAIILAYDFGPGGAVFLPAIRMTLDYDPTTFSEDITEQSLYIAYWDGSSWVALETTVDTMTRTASCQLSHLTTFALIGSIAITPPAPAAFSVSSLSVTPAEVKPEEAVAITVSVANTGGTEGSYSVALKINGITEAEKSVTVAPGSSQSVSFSVTREEAGSYSVDVNGLSGSFTVAAAEAPEAKLPIAWWIWVIAGVVVVGLIVFFLVRRKAY